ncbi:P27 family phage terminase small subunit [Bradyrhizobium monzae]|uniref:P27 family phage terminase small subunit n=1 Tax=Bradyrhizobium sp. Oc8 TaxID=2876780 RepID=UPI001F3CA039|nr:P27 family phage terminase small subunit [Bradyrhizobium sp. Oc8]
MTKPNPPAPAHLKAGTKAWWRAVVEEYDLEPHHLRLLQLAAEAWDSAQAARAVIQSDGMTFVDRFGSPRARPEVAIERDSRTAFARLVRELDLDCAPPTSTPRPPALNSNMRAANAH